MSARDKLVARLREKQGSMPMYKFAESMRVDPGMLSKIYSGDREIGIMTLGSIQYAFPDLTEEINAYLTEREEKRRVVA